MSVRKQPIFLEEIPPVIVRRLQEEGHFLCEPYFRRDLWYLNRPKPFEKPCIRLSQPNLHISTMTKSQAFYAQSVRFSQPNLHLMSTLPSSEESEMLASSPKMYVNRYSNFHFPKLMTNFDERRIQMSQRSIYSCSLLFSFDHSESTNAPLNTRRRERLSEPALVTGDYYPKSRVRQRSSHQYLGFASKRLSMMNDDYRLTPMSVTVSKNCDHIAAMAFSTPASYYSARKKTSKFNRDRFSRPEIEMENDLKDMANHAKQRFSLDSQLNTQSTGTKLDHLSPRNLSIPETAANQEKSHLLRKTRIVNKMPVFAMIPTRTSVVKKTLSGSTIRNPCFPHLSNATAKLSFCSIANNISEEPRHYAYTYEACQSKSPSKTINVSKNTQTRKQYLESNFDDHERVITTVIETERPAVSDQLKK